jgi:hypothetical protein
MIRKLLTFCVFLILVLGSLLCSKDRNPVKPVNPAVPGEYHVKIRNYEHFIWVGTNTDSTAQLMQSLVNQNATQWIGGRVVPDNGVPHGFYFDPSTIVIAEITVEGMQTTVSQITADPEYFSENGWSNGLAEHAWYVTGIFLEFI